MDQERKTLRQVANSSGKIRSGQAVFVEVNNALQNEPLVKTGTNFANETMIGMSSWQLEHVGQVGRLAFLKICVNFVSGQAGAGNRPKTGVFDQVFHLLRSVNLLAEKIRPR